MSEETTSSPAPSSRKGRPRGVYMRAETLAVHRAREHLIEALHALSMPDPDGIAIALLCTGMACLEIAKADPNMTAHDLALEYLKKVIDERREEESAEEKTT